MFESLEFAWAVWSGIPRAKKLAIIILSSSVPLSAVSIWHGLQSQSPLLLLGVLTLIFAIYTTIHFGFSLMLLLLQLLRFLVTLPIRLLRWVRHGRDSSASNHAADRRAADGSSAEVSTQRLGWFDLVFGTWFFLALLQVYLLAGLIRQ